MTVFLQGLTAKALAQWLGLRQSRNQGLVIVGGNAVGIVVARLLQGNKQKVAIVDSSTEACRQASSFSIPAFVSNGLDSQALAQAGLDSLGTLLALTVNSELNLVIAQRAVEEFRPFQVFAVYSQDKPNSRASAIIQAFGDSIMLETWNQCISQREVQIGMLQLEGEWQRQLERMNLLMTTGALLPLLYERPSHEANHLQIVPADMEWQEGDRIIYLLHTPRILPQGELPPLLSGTIEIPEGQLAVKPEQDYLAMAQEILKKVR